MHESNFSVFRGVSVEEIQNNPSAFIDQFKKTGVLAFRGVEYSESDVLQILTAIGSSLSWTPYANDGVFHWHYTQQYDSMVTQLNGEGRNAPDDTIIEWHVEGASLRSPQRAAGWNMDTFSAPAGTGQTGFVDMANLISKMPSHYVKLLSEATIIHMPNWSTEPESVDDFKTRFMRKVNQGVRKIWTLDGDRYVSSFARPAIENHPDFGFPVLRLCPCAAAWGVQDYLLLVQNGLPTGKEHVLFREIIDWVQSQICAVKENQIWWEWQENDFLIPDLFRMAHGVKGGFSAGQRKFEGYWTFAQGSEVEPTEYLSREEYKQMVGF